LRSLDSTTTTTSTAVPRFSLRRLRRRPSLAFAKVRPFDSTTFVSGATADVVAAAGGGAALPMHWFRSQSVPFPAANGGGPIEAMRLSAPRSFRMGLAQEETQAAEPAAAAVGVAESRLTVRRCPAPSSPLTCAWVTSLFPDPSSLRVIAQRQTGMTPGRSAAASGLSCALAAGLTNPYCVQRAATGADVPYLVVAPAAAARVLFVSAAIPLMQ
jgi:hypothetical protein